MRVPTIARITMALIGIAALIVAAVLVIAMAPKDWQWTPALAAAVLLGVASDLLVAAWRASWPVTATSVLGVH